LVALVLVLRLSGKVAVGWRPAFAWVVMRQSFPYALLILLMTFYYRIDTLMLERMLPDGPVQAGIYAQAFRFFEALNMLGYLMAGLLLPMFSRMLGPDKGQGTPEGIRPLVVLAMRLVLTGTVAVAVFGVAHAKGIMDLRYSEHTAHSAPIFSLLVGCFVAVCTTYVFGTLLTAGGKLRQLNWMAAGGALLNIGLNLVLIPRAQAEGAAWASLVTQVLTAVAQLVLAAVLFGAALPWALWLRAGAYALGLAALAYCLGQWATGLLPQFLAFALGALVWAWATGMVGPRVLREAVALKPVGKG
jgi:O-antigen/teichoic acid export membrane protein